MTPNSEAIQKLIKSMMQLVRLKNEFDEELAKSLLLVHDLARELNISLGTVDYACIVEPRESNDFIPRYNIVVYVRGKRLLTINPYNHTHINAMSSNVRAAERTGVYE